MENIMRRQPLYQAIAEALEAIEYFLNAPATGSQREWLASWKRRLSNYVSCLPHGGGFGRPELVDELSRNGTFRIDGSCRATDSAGNSEGWRDFSLTVEPNLAAGFALRCSFRGKLGDYVCTEYEAALYEPVDPDNAAR
jgi:hypothetical protein